MATNFPTSLDTFSNPTGTDLLENATAALDHDFQHTHINDAVLALQTKIGVNGSAVNTTFDFKLSGVATGDKAVSKTGTETLTNKTLTAPQINIGSDAAGDMYYRSLAGMFSRFAIGTTNQILSVDGSGIPIWIANPSASDASTTVKGVSEEATLAETLARTATGSTSARLFVNPSTLTTVMTYDYVVDTGSATAYAIAPTPAVTAYVAGQEFSFKAVNANTSTTPTLAVSGLASPKTIVNIDGTPLVVGQIGANSQVKVRYDGTNMVLLVSSNQINYNSIVNTAPNAQTYITFTSFPQDGVGGWTTPAGTGTNYTNGINVVGGNTADSLQGTLGIMDSAAGMNAFTELKMSYTFKNQSASQGTTAFGGTDRWFFHGISSSATISTIADITQVTRRIGFVHYNGIIYAVTGDNSTVTATSVVGTDTAITRHFMIDYTSTSVKFYIAGVLVATHTTSIPTDGTQEYLMFGGAANAADDSCRFFVSGVNLSQLLAS